MNWDGTTGSAHLNVCEGSFDLLNNSRQTIDFQILAAIMDNMNNRAMMSMNMRSRLEREVQFMHAYRS
jgi:hypothetical protein